MLHEKKMADKFKNSHLAFPQSSEGLYVGLYIYVCVFVCIRVSIIDSLFCKLGEEKVQID